MNYPPSKTKPWSHQVALWDRAKEHNAFYMAFDMGGGKSKSAIDYANGFNCKSILTICPKSVITVWPKQFAAHSPTEYLMIGNDFGKSWSVARKVQYIGKRMALAAALNKPFCLIINYEAIFRPPMGPIRDNKNRITNVGFLLSQMWDLVILDECVPAQTKIATPYGNRNIEDLLVGDIVFGVDNERRLVQTTVQHCFVNQFSGEFKTIQTTKLTPNHPVWTDTGYKNADLIDEDDKVITLNDNNELRMVWSAVNGKTKSQGNQTSNKTPKLQALLRKIMLCEMEDVQAGICSDTQYRKTSRIFQTQYECFKNARRCARKTQTISIFEQQSFAQSEEPAQSTGGIISYWLSAFNWWQRHWANKTATQAMEPAWQSMVSGICCLDEIYQKSNPENAKPLQGRLGESKIQDSDRNKWTRSFNEEDNGEGSKKTRSTTSSWMANTDIYKQRNYGQSGNRTVYNIETGTGNYFANGLLVHNCHRIKSPGGEASWMCKKLTQKSKRRLLLSGTPMPHGPEDLYAQFRFLDPTIFGTNYTLFRSRYCVMGGFENRQIVNYVNLDELNQKFYSRAYRVRTRDVIDLPEAIHETRTCELGGKARKIYDSLERDLIAELENGEITVDNALVKLLRLAQMTSGYVKNDQGVIQSIDTAKFDLLKDIVADIALNEPLIVICRFTDELNNIRRILGDFGRKVGVLHGKENNLTQFHDGSINDLVVQIQAGNAGIDLTRAHYCIYFSKGYNLGEYMQSLARTLRPGQKQNVTYYHLLVEQTVDMRIMNVLNRRQKLIDLALDSVVDQAAASAENDYLSEILSDLSPQFQKRKAA